MYYLCTGFRNSSFHNFKKFTIMTVLSLEFKSIVIKLQRSLIKCDLGAYWISVRSPHFAYTSLFYSKKQAYDLFAKLCTHYLCKSYISYI